jgi:hypothetical protein
VLVLAACGRSESPSVSASGAPSGPDPSSATTPSVEHHEPGVVDLLPLLRNGTIETDGPVVDLGEPQAAGYLVPPLPLGSETINGDSWGRVGPRLRLRVPVSTTAPPTAIRLRVRRVHARGVVAVVDGVPVRTALLPTSARASVVTLPVAPDRFRRDVAEVELRFFGISRLAAPNGARTTVAPARPATPAVRPTSTAPARGASARTEQTVADIDWVHLASGEATPARASDLVADVRADGPPRRALTLYAPTRLSIATVIPAQATLRAALSAEGIRGGARGTVSARIRIEADGEPAVELHQELSVGARWREVSLDLSALAGKAARISVAAEEGGDTRLAIADPRLVGRVERARATPPAVRRVLMLVVRGARFDRFAPEVSSRFAGGGFARMAREGLVAQAVAPSPRSLASLASVVTGLPAEMHGMLELTDTLDEDAPTVGGLLREAGVTTASFSDEPWWQGSGLDRDLPVQSQCNGESAAACRAETVLAQAGEWLLRQREHRAFALVVTRVGLPPFEPPPDLLTALEPSPEETALTPEQTGLLALRSRRGGLALEPRQLDRLSVLYDAALAGVDRGLATLLERLRDAGFARDTAVIVVGDRGVALGESGLIGDGPMSLASVAHTVLMLRAPGVVPGQVQETVSVLDAAATVLERLGAVPVTGAPGASVGATSLLVPQGASLHPRGVITQTSLRGDLGLRFGELLAIGRGAGSLVLVQPEQDPFGQRDLSLERPIARAYAESVLASHRAAASDEPARRVYQPSTRALSPAVEAMLRSRGWLRR